MALNRAIKQIKSEGRSVLIMAHRPAAIQECDMLLVIDKGTQTAFGPKDKVLQEMVANHQTIRQATSARPDIILMDVVMPGMNGFQATRTLSRGAETASIPIVVISSKSQETDKLWAMRQGAREYIVKPVKESELISKVNGVING